MVDQQHLERRRIVRDWGRCDAAQRLRGRHTCMYVTHGTPHMHRCHTCMYVRRAHGIAWKRVRSAIAILRMDMAALISLHTCPKRAPVQPWPPARAYAYARKSTRHACRHACRAPPSGMLRSLGVSMSRGRVHASLDACERVCRRRQRWLPRWTRAGASYSTHG